MTVGGHGYGDATAPQWGPDGTPVGRRLSNLWNGNFHATIDFNDAKARQTVSSRPWAPFLLWHVVGTRINFDALLWGTQSQAHWQTNGRDGKGGRIVQYWLTVSAWFHECLVVLAINSDKYSIQQDTEVETQLMIGKPDKIASR